MFDCDGHIIEDSKAILEYLDSTFRGKIPLINSLANGFSLWPSLDGFSRPVIAARRGSDSPWHTSATAWLNLLDDVSLDWTVLYPTAGLSHGLIRDSDWSIVLARAYNDWMRVTYGAASDRLRWVALLPLDDPGEAAAELERAVGTGAVGAVLAAAGLRVSLGDPRFAPLYAAAERLDVPLVVHGASAVVVPDLFERFSHLVSLPHPFLQMICFDAMVQAGVFDRFPKLKVGFFEAGSAWVPFIVGRLDRTFSIWGRESYEEYAAENRLSPSEVIQAGKIFFTVEGEEPITRTVLDLYGSQCLCFASDYPHEQSSPKHVQAEIDEVRSNTSLDETQRNAILNDNALRLYSR